MYVFIYLFVHLCKHVYIYIYIYTVCVCSCVYVFIHSSMCLFMSYFIYLIQYSVFNTFTYLICSIIYFVYSTVCVYCCSLSICQSTNNHRTWNPSAAGCYHPVAVAALDPRGQSPWGRSTCDSAQRRLPRWPCVH